MPNENTILAALGLDTTQYETGVNLAIGKTNSFIATLNGADEALRAIPIAGQLYGATFGLIFEGFANMRNQAREFDRIMRVDVSGSFEGTLNQIYSINDALEKIKKGEGTWAQGLSDTFRNLKNIVAFRQGDVMSPVAERQQQQNQLEAERVRLQEQLVSLYDQQAKSQSEAYSKSSEETASAALNLSYHERNIALDAKFTKEFGPDQVKWTDEQWALRERIFQISRATYELDKQASAAQFQAQRIDFDFAAEVSRLKVDGNNRDIAAAALRRADAQAELAVTKEQKAAAAANQTIAYNALELAKQQYDYAVRQSEIQSLVADLQVRGQTRAANQARIRAEYEVRIADAHQHGNAELAAQLEAQRDSALLGEQIREYSLGARGRAAERLAERHNAQIARIVQSQQHNKEYAEKQSAKVGGSLTGKTHLEKPGHLILPKHLTGSLLDRRPQSQRKEKIKIDPESTKPQEQILTDIYRELQGANSR